MFQNNLPLPPFGALVLQYQKNNINFAFPLYIYVGNKSFNEARINLSQGSMALALPINENSEKYYWPIKDQKIVVIDTGSMTTINLKKICFHLLKFKPLIIYLYSDMGNELFLLKKE